MTNSGNPLHEPVRVIDWDDPASNTCDVRPSDVLAALTDEQRDALADRIARAANLSAGQQRGLAGWEDDWDTITEQERGGWRILARACVEAVCR